MEITVLTIFPDLFASFIASSLIGKAIKNQVLKINLINIRDYATAPHFKVDDSPYGGGAGMLLMPEPLALAIEAAKSKLPTAPVILLSPRGTPYQQSQAHKLSQLDSLILVCGRYEGVDQRIIDLFIDQEISIGDYILMGGELPAMVVIESCVRLTSSAIGNVDSTINESFGSEGNSNQLEASQYTRPAEFRGLKVPQVLLSGNHQEISKWRNQQAQELTTARRPDLLRK